MELNNEQNRDGLRVVAVAYRDLESWKESDHGHYENDLIFLGFISFLDPPKETTAPAIAQLIELGVTVKVLTGDSPIVCKKICDEVNLPVSAIFTTADLQNVTDDELADIAELGTIFAKLTPVEKSRLVKVLKRKHIVGFLGDGINDAAALRSADVGISVDSAVDVAKESADIILLEKSLLVLVQGVRQGRVTYGNSIKYIKMAVSSNFGNVFSVLVASAWLPFLPMQAQQLLVQNLLYDFSQIAIPWDHMDEDWLRKPSNWSVSNIIKFMICMGPISSIFDMTTFSFMWFYYDCRTPDMASLFQSAWFVEGLLTQTSIVHMIRSHRLPFIQTRASWQVVLGTGLVMAAGIIIPFTPLGTLLQMRGLPGLYFVYLIGAILTYAVLTQLAKFVYIKIFKSWM